MWMEVASSIINETGSAVTKIGATERTLFVWVMIAFLMFSGFFMWLSSESQREQRDTFLNSMDRRDDKMSESLNKVTDALNKNTEVMIEIKSRIKN